MADNEIVKPNEEFGEDGPTLPEEREEEMDQTENVDGGHSTSGTVDASTEQILLNAKQVGDVTRTTRNRMRVLETSTEPRDMLKRVKNRIATLRQKLLTREENKKETTNAIAEFERYFDEEGVCIETDLALLDGVIVVQNTERKERSRLVQFYEEEKNKVSALDESLAKAVDGTDFSDLTELRAHYDELCENKRAREERDAKILSGTAFDSIEELEESVQSIRKEYTGTKLCTMVTEALDKIGHDDLDDVVVEMIKLRKDNDEMVDVLDRIKYAVQVDDMHSIMESIQLSTMSRAEMEANYLKVQESLAKSQESVEKLTKERNEANGEIDRLKRTAPTLERSEPAAVVNGGDREFDAIYSRLQKLLTQRSMTKPIDSHLPTRTREQTSPELTGGEMRRHDTSIPGANTHNHCSTSEREIPQVVTSVDPSMLPALELFDGTKEKWKMFKAGFLLRYEQMGDTVAKQLLSEMLTGRAKTEYKGLPDEYESRSIRDCLDWLKDRCYGSSLYSILATERKFRAMRPNGRKFDDVCMELEHMVAKLHPNDVIKQEEVKRVQLTIMYEKSSEYMDLLKMLQQQKSYSEMKNHMQVSEYMGRLEATHRSERSGIRVNSRSGSGVGNPLDMRRCFSCQGIGHGIQNCPSEFDSNGRCADGQCHRCGGMGHISNVCTSHESVKGQWRMSSEQEIGDQKESQEVNAGTSGTGNSPPILQPSIGNGSGWSSSGEGNRGGNRTWNGNGNSFMSANRIQAVRRYNPYERATEDCSSVCISDKVDSTTSVCISRENKSVSSASVCILREDGFESHGVPENLSSVCISRVDGSMMQLKESEASVCISQHRAFEKHDEPVGLTSVCISETYGIDRMNKVEVENRRDLDTLREVEKRGEFDTLRSENIESDGNTIEKDSFFFKKFRPVSGTIGGLQVSACLDTGADVNLVDKKTVDQMHGVHIDPEICYSIHHALRSPIKTVGTIVVDVVMSVGLPCRVGFLVTEDDMDTTLLGNRALESMGLELRLKHEKELLSNDIPGMQVVERDKEVKDEIRGGAQRLVCGIGVENGTQVCDSRMPIVVGHQLHPDYKCRECGRRKVTSCFPKEKGQISKMKFETMRELAALLDLKDMENEIAPLNVRQIVANRDVSSQSLKHAYEKGLCMHIVNAVNMSTVCENGVSVIGEDSKVSDALTEVFGVGVSRRPLLVFSPASSVVEQSVGGSEERERKYKDEEDLKTKSSVMETAITFPQSKNILLKKGMTPLSPKDFRADVEKRVKKKNVAVNTASDLLPVDAARIMDESNETRLAEWRLKDERRKRSDFE